MLAIIACRELVEPLIDTNEMPLCFLVLIELPAVHESKHFPSTDASSAFQLSSSISTRDWGLELLGNDG